MADYREVCPIAGISDDSLIQIFSYLSKQDRLKVETVCRRWQNIVQYTWSDVQKFPRHVNPRFFSKNQIAKILQLCSLYVRSIHIKKSEIHLLEMMAQTGYQQLETLKLDFDYRHTNQPPELYRWINTILLNTPNLITLEIGSIPHQFQWKSLENLPESLQHLSLDSSNTSHCLINFSKNPNLIALNLYGCAGNSNEMQGLENLTHLETLKLGRLFTFFDIWPTVANFETLRILELHEIRRMSTSDLKLVLAGCKSLEELTISEFEEELDRTVIDTMLLLKKLNKLCFTHVKFADDIGIGRLTTLTEFSVSLCHDVQRADYIALVTNCANLTDLWVDNGIMSDTDFFLEIYEILRSQPPRETPLTTYIDSCEELWVDEQNFDASILIVMNNI